MLVHVLGLLDVLAAGTLVAGHVGLWKIPLLYAAVYLGCKLFLFRDALSIIDAAAAVFCVLVFFGLHSGLVWVFLIFYAYKTSVWLFYTLAS
jgi:hypothetical protein